MGRSHLGQLVNPAGPGTQPRVARDSWSTPRAFRHGPEALGTTGQPRAASGTVPSCPGEMVYHMGPRTEARVATDAWSTTWYILPGSEWPGSAGHATGHRARARGAQDRWSNAGPRIRARVPRDRGTPRGPWPQARDTRDCWSTPHALGPGHESPRTAGKPRGSSDTRPSHAGQLVDTTGQQTRARFAREIWSKPRALGTGRESPGAAGRSRRP